METEEERKIKSAVREHVKIALIKGKLSIAELIRRLNEKYGRSDTTQNLSNKLTRGTLKYSEALEIADVLGFEIVWQPKAE